MQVCTQCGAELADSDTTCPACGAVYTSASKDSEMQARVNGSGAIAQGDRAAAAGAGGIAVSGDVYGGIHVYPPSPPRRIPRRVWTVAAGVTIMAMAALMTWFIFRAANPPPTLVAFSHPLLQKRDLNDVAAGNGAVWFATTQGLVWRSAATGQTLLVPGLGAPVQAVAVSPAGNTVWFSLNDGRVGRYVAEANAPELFTPSAQGQALSSQVLAILPVADGSVWFGDKLNGVFRFTSAGTWEAVPLPRPPPTLRRVEALALGPAQPPTLWAVGGTLVFRFQQDTWDYFDSLNTDQHLPTETANDIASDARHRIWFAHQDGISVLAQGAASRNRADQVWLNCSAAASGGGLPAGPVLRLAASDQGRTMWIVTEGGLARVDVSKEVLPPDCRDWGWHAPWLSSPALADFWSRDNQVRLAVDQLPTGDRITVWLVKLLSNRVLRLDWR